jgi:hypothetical protein
LRKHRRLLPLQEGEFRAAKQQNKKKPRLTGSPVNWPR